MKTSGSLRLCLVAALVFVFASAAHAATAFSGTLTDSQRTAAGLDRLTADERAALDQLVADDIRASRLEPEEPLAGRFSTRHGAVDAHAAGLDRLATAELQQLDQLVASSLSLQPAPKPRPRLKDNEVVSLARRLEVHGGFSFTYGWASGGRNFREAGAWVSYYDPVTGIGLSFAYSQGSGYPFYGSYPYYDAYGYGSGWGYGYGSRWGFNDYAFPMTAGRGRGELLSLGLAVDNRPAFPRMYSGGPHGRF